MYNADVIGLLATRKPGPAASPGSKRRYPNTGYAVLASIIEKVSGTSYADFLARHFFTPLGMKNTRVYNTRWSAGETLPNLSHGMVWSEKKKRFMSPDSLSGTRYVVKLDGVVGQGRVHSTTADLLTWSAAMTRPGAVLNGASLRLIGTPDTFSNGRINAYGYGVEIEHRPATGLILAHTGGWPGYQTLLYRFPEKNRVLIILSNSVHPEDDLMEASQNLAGLLLGM